MLYVPSSTFSATLFFNFLFGGFFYLLIAKPFHEGKVHAVPVPFADIAEGADGGVRDEIVAGPAKNIVEAQAGFQTLPI